MLKEFPEGDPSPGKASKTSPAGEEEDFPAIDLASLMEAYPAVRGWLYILGTDISYPVMQSSAQDPECYLHRNYKGEWDANGSLFLQSDCKVSESGNLIIYGHNMNSGAMFGKLDLYAKESYCREHSQILFQTADGLRKYQVAAVLKTDIGKFPFQQADFLSETEMETPVVADGAPIQTIEAYVKEAKRQSLFETGVLYPDGGKVVTLVTCSYEWSSARNVVVAVEIE